MVLRKALLFSSMTIALVVLSPAASSAAATLQRPVIGLGQGTQTISLLTGAGTGANHGFLLGIGYFTGSGASTFALTGPNTYSVTGTGTLLTANGEMFLASSGTGTLPGTTSGTTSQTSTTVDTITGGTGRFAGRERPIHDLRQDHLCLDRRIHRDNYHSRLLGWIHQLSRSLASQTDRAACRETPFGCSRGNECSSRWQHLDPVSQWLGCLPGSED